MNNCREQMLLKHPYIPFPSPPHMPQKLERQTHTRREKTEREERDLERETEEQREMTQTQSHSTRWSPTPEQLMLLEEMYRNGVRTPNATQIQQITAQLSRYGRIQGKNVFYWFQNHKARERQKIRRWLSRVYGGYAGPRNHFPYSQFHPLIFPSASQFQQSVIHPDGIFQSNGNAFHVGLDQGEADEDDPNFCYICSKLKQGFSEESVKQEWMAMMGSDDSIQRCRGTLRTLELFPTNGTDLKDVNNSQNCHGVMLPILPVDEQIA